MGPIVLDANAVIMHGRAFPERVRKRVDHGDEIVLPGAVKRELVDDVLEGEGSPDNHRASARAIEALIEEGALTVHTPDFERYGDVVDEARRRIADDSLPEHAVRADQYIPALVCEFAECGLVHFVSADRKLRRIVRDVIERRELEEHVEIADPLSVL